MLEQMYLITVTKISVLGPNFQETTTEFSRHKNRRCNMNADMNAGVHAAHLTEKFGRCLSKIRSQNRAK